MSITCCYIKEQYFKDHSSFVKMLDPGNTAKQSHRSYLCLKITTDGNDYYLPLRNNLGADVRPYGRIGHSVPSASRSDAGLDYRYALIVNDSKYIEIPTTQQLHIRHPAPQQTEHEVLPFLPRTSSLMIPFLFP